MEQRKLQFPILKAAHWSVALQEGPSNGEPPTFANWVLWVKVKELPLDLPLDPNARRPNIEAAPAKKVAKAIRATLTERPDRFVRLNSGLTVVARSCIVRDSMAVLHLQGFTSEEETDDGRRGDGVLNGGHTYAVIKDVLRGLPKEKGPLDPDPREAVVRVEVQTGVSEDELAEISRARNTSTSVSEFSIGNLAKRWATIERQLPAELRKRVAFLEGDERVTEPTTPVETDVGDLIKLLVLMNNKIYPAGKKEPVTAYTSEKKLIEAWNPDLHTHILPYLTDIIRLHDNVIRCYADKFGTTKGRKADGVRRAADHEPFSLLSGISSTFWAPPAFVYPVMAALRVFLSENGWSVSPDELIASYIPELCADAYEQYKREGRNSASFFGRNRQVWQTLALKTDNLALRMSVLKMQAATAASAAA